MASEGFTGDQATSVILTIRRNVRFFVAFSSSKIASSYTMPNWSYPGATPVLEAAENMRRLNLHLFSQTSDARSHKDILLDSRGTKPQQKGKANILGL